MNRYIFVLPLSEDECISIERGVELKDIDCGYEGSIFLKQQQKKTLITEDALECSLYRLKSLLEKCLRTQLLLHTSLLGKDIGLLYNQYSYSLCSVGLKEDQPFVFEEIEGSRFWTGMNYYLWASQDLVSWVYNDTQGNIFFEVTPFYPFLYDGAKEDKSYISFEQWIKDYKPYCVQKISKGKAQEWLNQADYVLGQIEGNVARWEKENTEL